MLTILAADEPPLATDELRHRVVLQPAFHPPALISARFLGDAGRLRLAARVRPWAADDPPVIHEAEATLPLEVAARLRAELEACVPGLDAPDDRRGVDGITVVFEIESAGARRRIAAWSPDEGQARHRHLAALHAAATAALDDDPSWRTLAQLHGYLDLGLPARDHGGAPRRIELFGRLTSSDEGPLAALFARLPAEAAVVVDMRFFEGMGTMLHPLLRRLSRRAGPIAWVVSPPAREHLRRAQVPERQLFDDLAAALRGLGEAG